MERDPRRLIARLAVAMVTADGRFTAGEREALYRLDELGLGPLSVFAEEEIARTAREPIDIDSAVAGLRGIRSETAAVIVSALAEVAASDREISPNEIEVLAKIAAHFGFSRDDVASIINATARSVFHAAPGAREDGSGENGGIRSETSPAGQLAGVADNAQARGLQPDLERAYRILGLPPGNPADAEAAYLRLVNRYNPARVAELGADFAALAVRRLAEGTAAFELVRAAGPAMRSADTRTAA